MTGSDTPMRLNASLDKWCFKSDFDVEGLTWARKLVDDRIIWANNKNEIISFTRIELSTCKKIHM